MWHLFWILWVNLPNTSHQTLIMCDEWVLNCNALLFSGDASGEGITPLSSSELVTSGESITLTCKYNGSYNTDSLLWYRQYSSSKPEFLFLVTEANLEQPADPPILGVSAKINEKKNRVDLKISSASVSDSALYYCALQPTVTGNTSTLYRI